MQTKRPELKTKRFCTGIEDIDAQHEQLYDTIEIFNYDQNSNEKLWEILMDVERYTAIHFQTEEKYMEKFEYPETNQHKKEHVFFTEKFKELKQNFAQNGFSKDFNDSFYNFLTSWLSQHYAGSDIVLAEFLNKRLSVISKES